MKYLKEKNLYLKCSNTTGNKNTKKKKKNKNITKEFQQGMANSINVYGCVRTSFIFFIFYCITVNLFTYLP